MLLYCNLNCVVICDYRFKSGDVSLGLFGVENFDVYTCGLVPSEMTAIVRTLKLVGRLLIINDNSFIFETGQGHFAA